MKADFISHTRIGGMPAALISHAELVDLMLSDAPKRREAGLHPKLVFDINGHGISLYARDERYRKAIEAADIVHADGQSVVFASKILNRVSIPDRSSTTDLFIDSLPMASKNEVSYFMFGGSEAVNSNCVAVLLQSNPELRIAGRRNGYFKSGDENGIIDEINNAGVDVLWVGLGKPLEQLFSVEYASKLKVGWIVTCGGLFNYIDGTYPRAPLWMQKAGLEWFHRLATNPRKLGWRYLTTSPHAMLQVLRSAKRRDD